MIKAFSKFWRANKIGLDEIKVYFNKCADDIDRTNMFMLRRTCMWTSIVFIGMFFLAYAMVPGFKLTPGHFLFFPLTIGFFFVNMYSRSHEHLPTSFCNFFCLFYFFMLELCLILMEISSPPFQPSRWFPLFLVVFPVLFIDRQYRHGIEETVMFVVYCGITVLFKEPQYFFRDMYTVLAAYLISMIVSRVVLATRAKQGLYMVELRRFGSMDKLTQVYNKAALLSEIEEYLTQRRDSAPCSMSIIDVDNFKQVNDGLGHEGGDQLLEQIGQLLLSNFRPSDIIGRFGGDEFIVFMPNMRDANLIDLRCRTLQMLLMNYNIGNTEPFTLSIGTIVDEGNHSQEELFRMADDALYMSKMSGKNCATSWIAQEHEDFTKRALVFVACFGEDRAKLLPAEEAERFKVFVSESENEALSCISQYRDSVALVVVEVNERTQEGELIIKYIKSRERFSGISILAVALNHLGERVARQLGADEVLLTSAPEEVFKETICKLTETQI